MSPAVGLIVVRGPCDVKQRGRDAQIGAGLLQLPGECPEPDAVHLRAGEHRDRIRAKGPHGGRDVVEASVHGHSGDLVALRWLRHAGADHRQPVIPIAAEFLDQVGHSRLMAHSHHAEHAAAGCALLVQPLADGEPGDQVEQRGAGQGDEHVAHGTVRG